MSMRLTITRPEAVRQVNAALDAHLERSVQAVGAIAVSQIRARFDSSGDPDAPWPDLWANDPEKVWRALGAAARQGRREKIEKAEKSLDRAKSDRKLKRAEREAKIKRAEARLEKARSDNPHYRAGGKPMLDTGASRASFFFEVAREGPGAWVVNIKSPLKHLVYHQSGFKTKGPNRVPITMAGAKGGGQIGVDFAVFRKGVTVPPRPMVRFTDENKRDIRDTLAG